MGSHKAKASGSGGGASGAAHGPCTCKKKPAKCSSPGFGGCYNRRLPSGKMDFGNRVRNRSRSVSTKEKCKFDPQRSCKPYCSCSCNLRLKRADKCINICFPIKEKTGNKQKMIAAFGNEQGEAHFYDGLGNDRGIVTPYICSRGIMINYGQRKKMKVGGKTYQFVYAFATRFMLSKEQIALGGGKAALKAAGWKTSLVGSGWVRQSALKHRLSYMPSVTTKKPPPGSIGPYPITGGNPKKYGTRKVVARSFARNEAATDYLARDGYHKKDRYVNLLFNLPGHGGVSGDTIKVGANFYRSRAVKPVKIPLYPPKKGTPPPKSPKTMEFLYGYVKTPSGNRYGWIATDALGKRKVAP